MVYNGYSNAVRLVATRARDVVTLAQKQLTCVGFATDDKYGPGPSFGNIEVVKEGSGALVTKDYGYSGSTVDPGPAGPDAATSVGTTGLTYDAFGRVATRSGGAESFAYDLAGRLVAVTRTAGQSEAVGYDPFGLPVSRTVSGQTSWYLGRQATVTGAGAAGGRTREGERGAGGERAGGGEPTDHESRHQREVPWHDLLGVLRSCWRLPVVWRWRRLGK